MNSQSKLLSALAKLESEFHDRFGEPPSKEVILDSLQARLDVLKSELIRGTIQSLSAPEVLFLKNEIESRKEDVE